MIASWACEVTEILTKIVGEEAKTHRQTHNHITQSKG